MSARPTDLELAEMEAQEFGADCHAYLRDAARRLAGAGVAEAAVLAQVAEAASAALAVLERPPSPGPL